MGRPIVNTTLNLVKERARKRKLYGRPVDDGYKICLGVEGGGFLGVISMGMLMALRDLELLDLFDMYVGSSAGSLNLVYAWGYGEEEGLSVYYDHVINHKFFDASRVVKGQHVFDMKVLEYIIKKVVPIPKKQIPNADYIYIAATCLDPVSGELINASKSGKKLLDYLLAASTIPFIGGDPRKVNGKRYIDGTFAYPDLLKAADELQCTHLLVLNTHTEQASLNKYDSFADKAYQALVKSSYPEVAAIWQQEIKESKEFQSVPGRVSAANVKPNGIYIGPTQHKMGSFTQDQWLIIDGARKGYQAVVKLFHPDATIGLVPEIL